MPAQKTVAISFRVSPRFKQMLEDAAKRECRSQTNMLEKLLLNYCEEHGITAASPEEERKGNKKK